VRAALLSLVGLAACSVPPVSLDGKQCPCTDGYVCDTLTNRCLAGVEGDGGIVLVDSLIATSCTAALANETELYRFTDTFDWAEQGGTWSGTASGITQSDKMANGFAYRTSASLNVPNVRVISSMRETAQGNGGTPGLGITIRTTLDGSTRYRCLLLTGTRQLALFRDDVMIGTPAATGATLPTTFTMEASGVGGALSCCIREIPSARTTATDTAIPTGFSGLEVQRKAAAYGSFVVFGSP